MFDESRAHQPQSSRRELLRQTGQGFGLLALADLLATDKHLSAAPPFGSGSARLPLAQGVKFEL